MMHLDIKDIISNNIMIFSKATTMYIALQIKLVLAVSPVLIIKNWKGSLKFYMNNSKISVLQETNNMKCIPTYKIIITGIN